MNLKGKFEQLQKERKGVVIISNGGLYVKGIIKEIGEDYVVITGEHGVIGKFPSLQDPHDNIVSLSGNVVIRYTKEKQG